MRPIEDSDDYTRVRTRIVDQEMALFNRLMRDVASITPADTNRVAGPVVIYEPPPPPNVFEQPHGPWDAPPIWDTFPRTARSGQSARSARTALRTKKPNESSAQSASSKWPVVLALLGGALTALFVLHAPARASLATAAQSAQSALHR